MPWNTSADITHMFGYPLPKAPIDAITKVKAFLEEVNKSSLVTNFLKENHELSMQEFAQFGSFIDQLETDKTMCHHLKIVEENLEETWTTALKQEIITLESGKRTLTFISVEEMTSLGYTEEDEIFVSTQ